MQHILNLVKSADGILLVEEPKNKKRKLEKRPPNSIISLSEFVTEPHIETKNYIVEASRQIAAISVRTVVLLGKE